METPVTHDLDARGIPYLLLHPPRAAALARAGGGGRGQRPEQVVRSILFRLANDQFVMVLAPGRQQISWPALRQHLGVRTRMASASPEEVLERTGYLHGEVSPFGLPLPDPHPGRPGGLRRGRDLDRLGGAQYDRDHEDGGFAPGAGRGRERLVLWSADGTLALALSRSVET